MSKELDQRGEVAWRTFLRAHASAIGLIEGELAAAGVVPLVEYDVLIALRYAPEERLRLRDLGRRVVLTRSGITRLVDRLEAKGLLCRLREGPDRRAIYAVLSDAGREAVRRAWPVYARGIEQHFARYLSEEELDVISDSLGKVADREE